MIWCFVLIAIVMARKTQAIKERLAPVYKHTTTTTTVRQQQKEDSNQLYI